MLAIQAAAIATYGRLHMSREVAHRAIALAKANGASEVAAGVMMSDVLAEALFGDSHQASKDVDAALTIGSSRSTLTTQLRVAGAQDTPLISRIEKTL